jgi:hypothetical protein
MTCVSLPLVAAVAIACVGFVALVDAMSLLGIRIGTVTSVTPLCEGGCGQRQQHGRRRHQCECQSRSCSLLRHVEPPLVCSVDSTPPHGENSNRLSK